MKAISLWTLSLCALAAQPKFEAASVKRTDQCGVSHSMGPGTVALRGVPLKPILVEAFKVRNDQIVGPSWLDDDCFDIIAKIPEGSTSEQVPSMLQALLAERFGLVVRMEDRPRNVYALVVDKGGPKLKAPGPDSPPGRLGFYAGGGLSGFKGAMTMAKLAARLSTNLDRPVKDETGLTGTYAVDLVWTPDPAFYRPGAMARDYNEAHKNDPPPDPKSDVFSAIRASLGLRLEPRKEPFEMLVIDHIERVPTGN